MVPARILHPNREPLLGTLFVTRYVGHSRKPLVGTSLLKCVGVLHDYRHHCCCIVFGELLNDHNICVFVMPPLA